MSSHVMTRMRPGDTAPNRKEDYAIIYITEGLYEDMIEDIEKYKDERVPAIIPIPGMDGSYGISLSQP